MAGWQYHPVLVVFQIGALLSVGVALYSFQYVRRHRWRLLVVAVGLLAFHNAIWNVAATLKVASTDLETKLLMYELEYLGSAVNPSVGFVLALAYVGYERWLSRATVAVLTAVPVATILLLLANPGESMIAEPYVLTVGGFRTLEHTFPPLFTTFLAWALGVTLLAVLVLIHGGVSGRVRKTPAFLLAGSLLLPLAAVSLKAGGVYPPGGDGVNVTPAANTASLAMIALAISRYRLFELRPLGRARAIDVMDGGYLLVDADGTVVDHNDAALTLVEADGPLRSWDVTDVVPQFDALADGETVTFSSADRAVRARSSRIDGGPGVAGRVLVLHDVTEQREHQREISRKNERLENFIRVVSHDLRNPLNVASGQVTLASEEVDSQHLGKADRALTRMDQLIEDLLRLARTGGSIDRDELQGLLLREVAETSWRTVDTADGILEVESSRQILAVEGRLQQLLENLFRNAVEHGGEQVTVTVGVLEDGFYVADDGPGIDSDVADRVFESGVTTETDGTGYGLAIVAEVVDAHDWSIEIVPDAAGTRFEITGVDVIDD